MNSTIRGTMTIRGRRALYTIAVLLGNPRKWYLKAHTAARMVLDELF